jgi:hypothetical protein
MLALKTDLGWRIAALFTTTRNANAADGGS